MKNLRKKLSGKEQITSSGHKVEANSSKYSPRSSDILRLPFIGLAGIVSGFSFLSGAIAQEMAPEAENSKDLVSQGIKGICPAIFYGASAGGMALATGICYLGNSVIFPLKKLEDYFLGKRPEKRYF